MMGTRSTGSYIGAQLDVAGAVVRREGPTRCVGRRARLLLSFATGGRLDGGHRARPAGHTPASQSTAGPGTADSAAPIRPSEAREPGALADELFPLPDRRRQRQPGALVPGASLAAGGIRGAHHLHRRAQRRTRGSRPRAAAIVAASFHAPGLWTDWRLVALGAAERQARYGYLRAGQRHPVRQGRRGRRRPRSSIACGAPGTAPRPRSLTGCAGPLQLALLAGVEHAQFTSLPGPSVFASEFRPGSSRTTTSPAGWPWSTTPGTTSTIPTRVCCSRPERRSAAEAGATATPGSTPSSAATCRCARARWWPRGSPARAWDGTPTLDARFTLPGWERAVPGARRRILPPRARLRPARPARGTLFGNFEVRHDLLLVRRSRRRHPARVPRRGAGVRAGVVPAHHRGHEGRRRRRGGAPDPAVEHLHVQLRRGAGRVQLLGGKRVDVLGGRAGKAAGARQRGMTEALGRHQPFPAAALVRAASPTN